MTRPDPELRAAQVRSVTRGLMVAASEASDAALHAVETPDLDRGQTQRAVSSLRRHLATVGLHVAALTRYTDALERTLRTPSDPTPAPADCPAAARRGAALCGTECAGLAGCPLAALRDYGPRLTPSPGIEIRTEHDEPMDAEPDRSRAPHWPPLPEPVTIALIPDPAQHAPPAGDVFRPTSFVDGTFDRPEPTTPARLTPAEREAAAEAVCRHFTVTTRRGAAR